MAPLDPAKTALIGALVVVGVLYLVYVVRGLRRLARQADPALPTGTPSAAEIGTGFVTNFFDTLGIGSFATTTSIWRAWKMVGDRLIPGSLNVGHTLPTIVQAVIYTQAVPVEATTLILMIAASVLGSWFGAGVVVKLPKRAVQLGMGTAMIAAAGLMLVSIFQLGPSGGTAIALDGGKLVFAVAVNFLLGALMTLGIGLYAPCLILISLLGMNPKAAFPIMMGSCAFLMPTASIRFVRDNGFHPRASLGLLLGGVPAVLIAALIVKSLPLDVVRWLVIVVVLYTAQGLVRAGLRDEQASPTPQPAA